MCCLRTMTKKTLTVFLTLFIVLTMIPGPLTGIKAEEEETSPITAIYFTSDDPENKGIDYVTKENKASGELKLVAADGTELYSGRVDNIRGRGNSTWTFADKKSYQFKLEKKADLLDPASGNQKAKKWILLANPFDPTHVRNEIILSFAKEMGLENSPEGKPVELYYDGDYRGLYYLFEKVEVGDGRVEIEDMDKAIEKANPDVDLDALTPIVEKDANGYRRCVYEGYEDPEDITGGYLLEMDSIFYEDQESWLEAGYHFVFAVKAPEYMSRAQADYLSEVLGRVYRCTTNDGVDPVSGKTLFELIDKESAARYFLVSEWFMNIDTYYSSTYLYKKAGDDKLYFGPPWDYDASMGLRDQNRAYDYFYCTRSGDHLGSRLFSLPEFRQAIQDVYKNEMRDKVFNILIGDQDGTYTKSTKRMLEETKAAALRDFEKWGINDCAGSYYPLGSYEENVEDMLAWMEKRAAWFDNEIMKDDFVSGNAQTSGTVERYAGKNRYETSIKVADALKEKLGVEKFDTVIIASGTDHADALAGSYLSCLKKAPILVVNTKTERIQSVQDYIRNNLKEGGTVYILGGSAAVSAEAEEGLEGFNVKRLSGKNRYETNLAILKEAGIEGDDILVCSSSSFADSLSAAAAGKPILLTGNALRDNQKEYLASLGSGKTFVIIGGKAAVNETVEAELKAYGDTARIGGSTRYETTVNVARAFFPEPKSAVLAYAKNFPDGLCGGVLANAMGGPLILTADGKTNPAENYVQGNGITSGAVLGGSSLLSSWNVKRIFGMDTELINR
ncbi:MAG: cell wall-binding repeat-containing protein [Erysipelotrichaceae bacterium]|nr:cell wall-binding repeat-containing protein [Erysipelotrichaceae bacterium]